MLDFNFLHPASGDSGARNAAEVAGLRERQEKSYGLMRGQQFRESGSLPAIRRTKGSGWSSSVEATGIENPTKLARLGLA
jgi:hypothetical protein